MYLHIHFIEKQTTHKTVVFSCMKEREKRILRIDAPLDLEGEDLLKHIEENINNASSVQLSRWMEAIVEIDEIRTISVELKTFLRNLIFWIRDGEIKR